MPTVPFPAMPLAPRESDLRLTDQLLGELALLSPLRRRPALYRFRGSVALRRCRAGETVARLGERGGGAFYVLTAADVLAVLNALCRDARPRRPDPALLAERGAARGRAEAGGGPAVVLRLVATPGPRLLRLEGDVTAGEPDVAALDGHHTEFREGELVGEAACLEGTPRPASVVAVGDGYLLEMRADFLAAVLDDPVHKARADAAYRAHALRLQLARLPLFRDLSDDEFARVRDAVELRGVAPDTVICDEHERCEGLYVVRSGVVRLVKNVTPLFGPGDVADWAELGEVLGGGAPRSPRAAVGRRLPAPVRALVRRAAPPDGPDPNGRAEVLHALNDLIASPDLLDEPELRPLAEGVLSLDREGARRANRRTLEAVLGAALRPPGQGRGPECVLNYCARGDAFGLADLLLNRPCSATAMALGHPNALGRVELAWLPAAAFWLLLREVPRLREPLKRETARQRRHAEGRLATPPWDDRAPQLSEEAAELGLVQGQQLMLIDLDRCTRCDDCVRACADTRDDGRSRLFLEGPRFGKHLVPATCRACLDPVCLIGCPVNSIHRGPGQEIVIEDWCIGCGLCGESCPYGAIQMHDLGLLPEAGGRWHFRPAEAVYGDGWLRPGFRTAGWPEAATPFFLDRTTRERLSAFGLPEVPRSLAFRHELTLEECVVREATTFRLEVDCRGDAAAWVNGRELLPAEKPRGARHVYTVPAGPRGLAAGANVLAVRVTLLPGAGAGPEAVFQARLDVVRPAAKDDTTGGPPEKPVTRKAAVCDLCAGREGGPACVRVCAHDAAFRVDARAGLPG